MNAALETMAAAARAITFALFGARRRSQIVERVSNPLQETEVFADASTEYMSPHRPTVPSSIIHIAALLRRLPLPAEIIPTILDYAAVWHQIEGSSTTRRRSIAQNMSGTIYHRVAIPDCFAPSSLRTISFTVRSHDQGWSSYPSDHGTYNGSWTWLEATVITTERLNSVVRDMLIARSNELLEGEGQRIVTNVHASREAKTHTVTWRYDDQTDAIGAAFKLIREKPKDTLIAIIACARYPGWTNTVEYGRIEFGYQPIRKM